jgi:hypothetical protein
MFFVAATAATTMRCWGMSTAATTMRCWGMSTTAATMRCWGMSATAATTMRYWGMSATTAVATMTASDPTVVSAATAPFRTTVDVATVTVVTMEGMPAPPVMVSPAPPWADTYEDAVVEIFRPPITVRSTTIWRVIVVSPLAYGRRPTNLYPNGDLCRGWGWRKRWEHRHQGTHHQPAN